MQIVLPDEKDNKKDVVVFLDASQAAGAEEEAQQAGALAALHSVAGDRAMHRILPQQYLAAWEWHGEQVIHSPPVTWISVFMIPVWVERMLSSALSIHPPCSEQCCLAQDETAAGE
jgi:hypothetical protein